MTDRYDVMLSLPLPGGELMGLLDEAHEARVEAAFRGAAGTEFDGTGSGFGNRDFFAVTTAPGVLAGAVAYLLTPGAQLTFRRLEEDDLPPETPKEAPN
jgi:hypothetical protein